MMATTTMNDEREAGHYVVTAHKPSSVLHAIQCHFTGQATKDVLIAKAGILEVRRLINSHDDDVEQDSISNMYNDDYNGGDDPRQVGLTPNNTTEDQEMMMQQQQQLESLPLVLEIPIRGRICILLSFRPPGSDRDFIFFTTERHKYAVLSYQSDDNNSFGPSSSYNTPSSPVLTTYSIDNIVTHDIGIINDQNVGREAECGPQAVVGSNNKCIIFHMYDGYIKTFPIKSYKPPPKGKSMTKSISGEYHVSTERSKPGSFLPATHNTRTGATVLGVPFHCRLHEHTVLTMTCLMEHYDDNETTMGSSSNHWVKLCILHQDSKGFQHLITHTIDVKKRKMIFTSLPSAMRRPNNTSSALGGSTTTMTSQGGPAGAAAASSAAATGSMKQSSLGDATGAAMTMSNPYGSSSTTSPTTSTTTDPSAGGPKRSRIDGGSCLMIPVPPMRVPSANVATAAAVASSSSAAAGAAATVVGSSGSPRMDETSGDGASTVGTGGLLVIGQMQILYVSAMNTGTKVLPIEPTLMICHTALPRRRGSDDTMYQCLLADERGLLFLLTLKRHPKTGACTTLLLDTMGLTSIATSLLSITPSVLYVGSRFGDSQLLRINRHRDEETNSFLEILDEYTNLGPIVDMDLVDYDRKGQSQVVTCSGTGRDGSLRIVRNGIGIHEQAHVEFPGIKGMWNLRGGDVGGSDGSSCYDRYLVQSFLEETRVLEITEDEMEETIAIEGFRSDQPTLFAGNVYYTSSSSQSSSSSLKLLLIQITESHVRLVDGTTLQAIDTWAPPTTDDDDEEDDPMMEDVAASSSDRKLITVANGNTSGQIVVALRGGILKYLCVVSDENEAQQQYKLKACATKCMDHEVSCIDLHPWTTEAGATATNTDDDDTMTEGTTPSASTSEVGNHPQSDVCAVGLWNDVSVRLLSLNTTTTSSTKLLDEILKLDLGGDTQARSLLLTKLEDNQPPLLLVGLGDGQLVTYFLKINNVTSSVKVISKKKVSLGTQSISLTVFQKHNPFVVDHRTTSPHNKGSTTSSSTCVFATGDRPTIVYMSGGKVLYSNVNLTGETTMDNEEDQLVDHGGGAGGGTSSSSSTTAINYVTPFHCELFPDCLCLASEETLRIGFIDDIQKLHVQTFPLRETPQRIVHHMEGRLFAVACLGDTSYDEDGTSTKAKANLTTSPVGGLTGNQQIVLQGNSLLFLDDTTLEDIDRIHLEPFELVMAVVSVPLGGVSGARIGGGGDVDNETQTKRIPPLPIRSYIVVGTGFAYPDEDEPTKGRILVFESVRSRGSVAAAAAKPKTTGEDDEETDMAMVSVPPMGANGLGGGRRIRQVTECIVNGGVYSMASFMEHKLLVTINQRVHVYNLIDDSVINRPNAAAVPQVLELKKESAEHHGHILSLCIKAHQNHVLVGDIMRSIGVLEYVEEGGGAGKSDSQTLCDIDKNTFLDEIARDYNSNWMTAIEILSNDTYLGTETYSNLFTLKRNTTSPLEEVRCRLMTHGEYNLGQMINKLARGSLVIPTNTSSAGTTTSSSAGDHSSPTKASSLMDTTSGSTPSKSKTSSPTIGTPSTPGKEGSSSGSSTPMDIVVGSQTLYGTVDGSIGCILGMNHETFQFFKSLECVMADYLPRIGGLRHEEFRSFQAEKRFHLCRHFIDGDLVESFLDLSRSQMEIIVELLQKPEAGGVPRHNNMSIEDVVSMVEEVSRLH